MSTDPSETEKSYTVEEAITHMGMGLFQYKMLLFTGFIWSADAMELMLLAFLVPKLKHEWNLHSPMDALISAVVFVGMLFGLVFWTIISDTYGRRRVVQFGTLFCAVFGTLSALAPNIWLLFCFGFGVGFCVGAAPVSYSLFAEVLPVHDRGSQLTIEQMFWSFGAIFSVLVAWFSLTQLNWRWYLFLCSLPLWSISLFSKATPESPRYLASKGRMAEAMEVLQRISLENGVPLPSGTLKESLQSEGESDGLKDIFHEAFGRTSPLLFALFGSFIFVYFGICFISERYFAETTSNGKADRFRDMTVTSVAELPSILIGIYSLDRFGRKNSMIWAMSLFAVCSLAVSFKRVQKTAFVGLCLLFVARLTAALCVNTIFIFFSEFYPTSIRTTALGAASSLGRISGMATSFVANDLPLSWSMAIYAAVASFAAVCAFALPFDTNGIALSESIAHVKSGRRIVRKKTTRKYIKLIDGKHKKYSSTDEQ